MSYENPEVPNEVNVARVDPLVEFLQLAAGLLVALALAGAALYFAGEHLARRLPFELERRWVGERVIGFEPLLRHGDPQATEIEGYLQRLAQGLSATLRLPDTMRVTLHYAEVDEPNAFATLGGHVVVTRGLYARMPSENALATVLAHEIGHVRAGDPIAALGGGASLALLAALLGGDAQSLAPQVAALVQRGYSREAERLADEAALEALERFYGHAGGAAEVFRRIGAAGAGASRLPTLLSTHPADAERIARLESAAEGWDPAVQPLRPLAVPIHAALPPAGAATTPR